MNTTPLRRYWILLAVLLGLCGGCSSMESVRSTMRDRIAGVPPKVRTVNGDLRQVYEAAHQTMDKLGYQFTGGGPAQKRLEGHSRIYESDDFKTCRQRAVLVRLEDLEGGRVEVQVQMTEIIAEDTDRSARPATETPLRDSTAYDAFFDELERRLQAPGSK